MTNATLRCLPAEPSHFGTQRCYLKPNLQKHLDLLIGQWITIRHDKSMWVCTVWPSTDLPEECIQLDKLVSMPNQTSQNDITGTNLTDYVSVECLESIEKVRLLDSISVTVLLESGQDVQENDLPQTALEKYLQQLLIGRGVVKLCKVTWPKSNRTTGFPKISSLLIEDHTVKLDSTTVQHECNLKLSCIKHVGIITPKTVVTVEQVATEDAAQNLTHSIRTRIAGLDDAVNLLKKLITYPVEFPNSFEVLNLSHSRGILIHGPTGVWKSSLVHYVTVECNAFLVQITGTDVFGASPGESESNLRAGFEKAKTISKSGNRYVVIFLDELDVLCPKRGVSGGTHESRIVAQLLLLMDEIRSCRRVMVVAATNRPNVIDPALRRPGRFDQEVG